MRAYRTLVLGLMMIMGIGCGKLSISGTTKKSSPPEAGKSLVADEKKDSETTTATSNKASEDCWGEYNALSNQLGQLERNLTESCTTVADCEASTQMKQCHLPFPVSKSKLGDVAASMQKIDALRPKINEVMQRCHINDGPCMLRQNLTEVELNCVVQPGATVGFCGWAPKK